MWNSETSYIHAGFRREKLEEREHLKDAGMDGYIRVKTILK
jgi:hypothetical protein